MQGALALIVCSFIWGTTFVFQSTGMDHIGALTFNTARNVLSAVFLAVLWIVIRRAKKLPLIPKNSKRELLAGGLCCGACLGLGMGLQQVGLAHTTVGKTGFISALYIILVPLIRMAMGRRYKKTIWACVLTALVGLFLLTVSGDSVIRLGDFLVFVSAVVFAAHILVVGYFSPRIPGIFLSCTQMIVAAVISCAGMTVSEHPAAQGLAAAGTSLLYAGIMSGGVAFTLQILAQKKVEPVVASLIMCFESVFAALAGWVMLGERLSGREWLGAALMFAAMITVQIVTAADSAEEEGTANNSEEECDVRAQI